MSEYEVCGNCGRTGHDYSTDEICQWCGGSGYGDSYRMELEYLLPAERIYKHRFEDKETHSFEEILWEKSKTIPGEIVENKHSGINGQTLHLIFFQGNRFAHIHCKAMQEKVCNNKWHIKDQVPFDLKFDVVLVPYEGDNNEFRFQITCKSCGYVHFTEM